MSAGRRPVSVLVVDDDADIRDTIDELLVDAGYTVASAANGAEALAELERVQPGLILLDLSMPVMSGQQFRCRQLADPRLAAIPTVVMTAADRVAEKTAAMQPAAVLPKPIKMQQLLDRVAHHCGAGGHAP